MSRFIPCPKCGEKMERGNMRNEGGKVHWGVYPWYPDPKTLKRTFMVLAYRCLTCGFIELYARNWDEEVREKEAADREEEKIRRQALKEERKRRKESNRKE